MQNKRKILFFIESLAGGGAEKVLVTLLKHLDPYHFNVTLCCVTRVGKYLDDVPSFVDFRCLLPDPKSLMGLSLLFYKVKYKLIFNLPPKWTYRLFIPKGNDVEIAFLEGSATKILSGSTNHDARKIAWVHNDMKVDHWTTALYRDKSEEEIIYNAFDLIATVSDSSRRVFQQELPNVQTPIRVIYNPIDRNEIISLASTESVLPARKEASIRLISIGRLVPQKAFDRLLRVFKGLKDKGFNLELWILGEGQQRMMLQDYINNNVLAGDVVLWGFQSNPYPFLAQSDLFVCSSLTEGFSTAATEAVVLGVPFVSTACSGMRELLGEDDCGLIVENDEDALSRGLERVLKDPALLEKMKIAAQKRSAHFAIDQLMSPITTLLEETKY